MPDLTAEQRKNIRKALATAKKLKASPRETKALVEAMGVESGFRHLTYGDRDSTGILQQRDNGAWGKPGEPVETDVAQFLKAARSANTQGGSAGDLAQRVQRSGYPKRYGEHDAEATSILASYGGVSPAPSRQLASTSKTVTSPGVDNSGLRKQLVGQFLQQGGVANPNAVLTLAGSYGQAADIPGTSKTTTTRQPARHSTSTPRSDTTGPKGSKVLELIHNDGGTGYGIKNGQKVDAQSVYAGVWEGHKDHVHVAAGRKTVVALGKLAQRMGLHVGENSHFGGVNPGAHVDGSYHVEDEAIDVSGDPKKMNAYARAVEKYNRTHRLPR